MARRGNGSSAYRLYEDEPANLGRQTTKQLQPKKNQQPTQREKQALPTVALKNEKTKRVSSRMIANVLLLCLMAFAILFRYSAIVERDHQLESLKTQRTALADENKRLQVEIDSALNLDNVEEVAMNQLGMAKPEKYQTVYVDIQGEDYVEVAEETEDEPAEGKQFYATIIQTLGNVLEYLY